MLYIFIEKKIKDIHEFFSSKGIVGLKWIRIGVIIGVRGLHLRLHFYFFTALVAMRNNFLNIVLTRLYHYV